MSRLALLGVVAALLLASCGGGGTERVVVAAGTTVVDSGLLDRLVAAYETAHPDVELSVVPAGSTEVLALGARGAADLLLSHLPAAEEEFLAAHPDAVAADVFTSGFLLVGPPGQDVVPPGTPVVDAFARIAAAGAPFVTRNDGSGTNVRERTLWRLAGIDPSGETWYVDTGQGMGFTLQVADQRGAFTLSEAGAFTAAAATLSLAEIAVTDPGGVLVNPYRGIVVDPAAHPGARRFLTWLTSPAGREAIRAADEELFGRPVYRPAP